ncbi:hypothetical protein FQA39_LY00013 [Lamprigera yunnana]|nr:hypothetical protein FQA39_LY00013 [Lamprigera yunnana]
MSKWLIIHILIIAISSALCLLYPQESETREVLRLDGLWNFVVAPPLDPFIGTREQWYNTDLSKLKNVFLYKMPVPASYNDITTDIKVRDHVGVVWYDRTFFLPQTWNVKRTFLRFSAVHYAARVWINGKYAIQHEIGHLPFETEISLLLNFGTINRVTVLCNNTLSNFTIPQGYVEEVDDDYGKTLMQYYTFDFFNYAGIHRTVYLYTTPLTYISDIIVTTNIIGTTGVINYNAITVGENLSCVVTLLDKKGIQISISKNNQGAFNVENAHLWWPYLMSKEAGYLYTLKVELQTAKNVVDVYRQRVGIRSISWTNTTLLLNDRAVYFHGFGKHEDADIRGKGFDWSTAIKDFNLIEWIRGNAFRTSHYPYAEEILDLADEFGIMIIDECPSVNTELFSNELLSNHKQSLTELYHRDKNHPSVIMWSIANEPRTQSKVSGLYFEQVAEHMRAQDKTRPLTLSFNRNVHEDYAGQYVDIISFNRYNAWYANSGSLNMIVQAVVEEATEWHQKYNKPVLMSEYGADTMAGLHIYPEYIWSEEFQAKLMANHFKAFDTLRKKIWFLGEFIWNFADFKTAQTYKRVGGNKKGIFTRDRQPKMSAHLLRKRYSLLARQLYTSKLPKDIDYYVHEEL